MADIAPKLLHLSGEELLTLHTRVHKSEANPATIEVHHTILNEMARRKMERPRDDWDKFELLVDSNENVDLASLAKSFPREMMKELLSEIGSDVADINTYFTANGYEMRLEAVQLTAVEKMIRQEGNKFVVYNEEGSRKFGTYGTKKEAEERLAQMEQFKKADNTPPKAVRVAARRALDWIADGKAGSGFTSVGRARATQLANGEAVSIDTLKRMKSFLARHEVDKEALGFTQGEKGFPSAGRVSWDAWGGDAGYAWAESMVARAEREVEKHLQGQHDQQRHAPGYADKIADEINNGENPSVSPLDVGPLMSGFAKRTDHPDLTELKVNGTMLYGDEGMGIARKDMPQIPGKARPEFLSDLEAEGIKVDKEKVDPKTLKPIQKEISASRSGAIYERYKAEGKIPKDERILVSKDGFVIDGHHTWGAAVAFSFENNAEIPIYRIGLNAKEALARSSEWATSKGYEGQALDAPAKKSLVEEFDDLDSIILKHGTGDQKPHGSWANGASSEIPALVPDKAPTAERSADATRLAKELRTKAESKEPVVTDLMKTIAGQSGGEFVQLENRLKTTDGLARKIDSEAEAEYGGDREKAAANISDALRYTLLIGEDNFTEAFDSTMNNLKTLGFTLRPKNFWQSGDPYDGVNLKAKKDGIEVEIQLHTKASFSNKEGDGGTHKIYEKYRIETDNPTRESLWNSMLKIASNVQKPANYAKLLTLGVLVLQQYQTAQQAGLTKSTPVDNLSFKRGGS